MKGASLLEENVAIIDLGSNSVRAIIMRINYNTSYKMVEHVKEMVRLSENMWESNLLNDAAMKRTIIALKNFRNIIKSHKVKQTIALATSAVRNASNGRDFLKKIYAETGFEFKIISGQEEAFLGYLGVINSIDIDNCIIIDTGGGSTELVLVEDRKIKNSISIPYGAVTLTESFLGYGNTSNSDLKKTESYLKKLYKSISWLKKSNSLPIVGLGGSIRTLSKIHKRNYGFERQPIHNYNMKSGQVNLIFNKIKSTDNSERKNIPGLNKERSDIILGGLLPLKVLIDYIQSKNLIISGHGLREGTFFDHYFNKFKLKEGIVADVLQHSIDNILLKYDVDTVFIWHLTQESMVLLTETW